MYCCFCYLRRRFARRNAHKICRKESEPSPWCVAHRSPKCMVYIARQVERLIWHAPQRVHMFIEIHITQYAHAQPRRGGSFLVILFCLMRTISRVLYAGRMQYAPTHCLKNVLYRNKSCSQSTYLYCLIKTSAIRQIETADKAASN